MMITIRALKTGRFNNDNSGIIKFLFWCEHNGRAASVQRFGFSLHTTRPLITNKIPPIEQTNFGPKKYFHTYELARVRTSNFDLSLNALPWFMMSRRRDNGEMSSRGKSPVGENKYRGGTSDATTSSSIIVSSIMMSFYLKNGHSRRSKITRDIQTEGRTDGRTRPLIEMRSHI